MQQQMLTALTAALTLILALSASAQAQDTGAADLYTRPQLDRRGDYLTNGGPVQGQARARQTPGALWKVLSAHLNCRAQPGTGARILRRFRAGTLLQANLGRGGSDEVYLNARDARGRTWMLVRSPRGDDYGCYVRASRNLIRPLERP